MSVSPTMTLRILVAAARRLPIRLDEKSRPWLEQLMGSGHIMLNEALDPQATTATPAITSLGQEFLDWLEQ